jgi:hypothetical protein
MNKKPTQTKKLPVDTRTNKEKMIDLYDQNKKFLNLKDDKTYKKAGK